MAFPWKPAVGDGRAGQPPAEPHAKHRTPMKAPDSLFSDEVGSTARNGTPSGMAKPPICNPPGHRAQSQSIPRPLAGSATGGTARPARHQTWILGTGSSARQIDLSVLDDDRGDRRPYNLAVAPANGCITA
jgi:hypothetical protein